MTETVDDYKPTYKPSDVTFGTIYCRGIQCEEPPKTYDEENPEPEFEKSITGVNYFQNCNVDNLHASDFTTVSFDATMGHFTMLTVDNLTLPPEPEPDPEAEFIVQGEATFTKDVTITGKLTCNELVLPPEPIPDPEAEFLIESEARFTKGVTIEGDSRVDFQHVIDFDLPGNGLTTVAPVENSTPGGTNIYQTNQWGFNFTKYDTSPLIALGAIRQGLPIDIEFRTWEAFYGGVDSDKHMSHYVGAASNEFGFKRKLENEAKTDLLIWTADGDETINGEKIYMKQPRIGTISNVLGLDEDSNIVVSASSVVLKENIVAQPNYDHSWLSSLELKNYNYIGEQITNLGLIAEEVVLINPAAVTYKNLGGTRAYYDENQVYHAAIPGTPCPYGINTDVILYALLKDYQERHSQV